MDYSIWKTANGEFLRISEMSIDHIENCMAMIERSRFKNKIDRYEDLQEPPLKQSIVDYEQYKPYLKVFKDELLKRGRM